MLQWWIQGLLALLCAALSAVAARRLERRVVLWFLAGAAAFLGPLYLTLYLIAFVMGFTGTLAGLARPEQPIGIALFAWIPALIVGAIAAVVIRRRMIRAVEAETIEERLAPIDERIRRFLAETHRVWSEGTAAGVGRYLRRAARTSHVTRFINDWAAELGRVLTRLFARHGAPEPDEYLTGFDRMGMRWLLTNRRLYVSTAGGLDESDTSHSIPLADIADYEVRGRRGWTKVTMTVTTRDGQRIEVRNQLITPHPRLLAPAGAAAAN